jgi:translation initiation factor 2 subunit 1
MRKQGMPRRNEVVVCRVVKIFPNSAFAELIEYKRRGMIHVSEVALKWVKDIREFIKEKQYVVCRVMKVDGNDISLSVKRVRKEEGDRKLAEFKRERKAEKMLELLAKKKKKSLDDAYKEVGYDLEEEFGSLNKAFEFAIKNPDLLQSKVGKNPWLDDIIEMAKKSYSEKVYTVKANMNLICYTPDGIETIKKALKKAGESGVDVQYVSAPKYVISAKGKNFRDVKEKVVNAAEAVSNEINGTKGTCEFKLVEE